MIMSHLSYQLSTEREDEVRDSLLESAITRATQKAQRAGEAMGRTNVDIAVLEVDSALNYDNPVMMRAMADTAEMASPVAEAGESEVTLTVRVQAVIK